LIGQVGNDIYGTELIKFLRAEGVSVENVSISHGTHTGVALIGVEASGLNSIIAVYGANMDDCWL
jgi:ribokinase